MKELGRIEVGKGFVGASPELWVGRVRYGKKILARGRKKEENRKNEGGNRVFKYL